MNHFCVYFFYTKLASWKSHHLPACLRRGFKAYIGSVTLNQLVANAGIFGSEQHMLIHHITIIIIPWLEQSLDKLFSIAF